MKRSIPGVVASVGARTYVYLDTKLGRFRGQFRELIVLKRMGFDFSGIHRLLLLEIERGADRYRIMPITHASLAPEADPATQEKGIW